MATTAARRPVMVLYSGKSCALSHCVRIVLAEKNLAVEVIDVDKNNISEDLIDLNAYGALPTLVDRDLVLYDSAIITEYLDERFPHPPLMPVDPVSRARVRTMLQRIDEDWYGLLDDIDGSNKAKSDNAIKAIRDGLTMIAPVLTKNSYLMSEDFSLIECSMAPLLWRLSHLGVELPSQAKSVHDYAQRLFDRDSFVASLTEVEKEMAA